MRVLAFPRAAMPLLAAGAMLACQSAHGVAADAWALNGDVGLGAVTVQGPAPGQGDRTRAIPYVYAFQETPWGGVFLDAFGDIVSGGTLLVGKSSQTTWLVALARRFG
jgi:hypothetical protein